MGFVERLSTGCEALDWLLSGGLETDIVTTVYGGPGTGKTNFALMITVHIAKTHKVVFIDTEGSYSIERLKQIAGKHFKNVLSNTFIKRPVTFEEQSSTLMSLKQFVEKTKNVGLIVLDSAATLYRLEFTTAEDIPSLNKDFALQLSQLVAIARTFNIPVFITNQVYTDMDGNYKMVGGNIIDYKSKCLIELRNCDKAKINNKRIAILRKHRSIPPRAFQFRISNSGISLIKKIENQIYEKNNIYEDCL